MAIKKIKQQRRNDANNGWDIIHNESSADIILYDNVASGLTATKVQAAIDEIFGLIPVDTNDYVNSIIFNTGDGILTLGRTGALGDLTTDLDGRYSLEHSHPYDNYGSWLFAVDGVTKDAITSGDILDFIGGSGITITRSADDKLTFVNDSPHIGTNISVVENATTVSINSSTGNNDTIAAVTTLLAGVMTAADKVILDGIATGGSTIVIEQRTDDPVSPAVGRIWVRTD